MHKSHSIRYLPTRMTNNFRSVPETRNGYHAVTERQFGYNRPQGQISLKIISATN